MVASFDDVTKKTGIFRKATLVPPLQSSFSTTLAIPNLAWRCQTRVMMEPEGEEFLNSFGTLSKYQEVTNAFFDMLLPS